MSQTAIRQQIIAQAYNDRVIDAGQSLAKGRLWLRLGQNEHGVWGECQGSARDPYRTSINFRGPAFHCDCPSGMNPCKHALGLFLLFEKEPQIFTLTVPPWWIVERFTARRAVKPEP